MVERRTGDREVSGANLTLYAVEYGPGQAAHAHLLLSPSSTTWCLWRGKARKVTIHVALAMALAMPHRLCGISSIRLRIQSPTEMR